MVRLIDVDHGETITRGDGYMTARFMYCLQDDEKAGDVFFGSEAELLTNKAWQDVEINEP